MTILRGGDEVLNRFINWLFPYTKHEFNYNKLIEINGINRCSSIFNNNYVDIPFSVIKYECLKCGKKFTKHEIEMFEFNGMDRCNKF